MRTKLTFKSYKAVTLIYYLAVMSPMQILAQEIAGRITNKKDGSPLADVTVINKTAAFNTKSNADGTFRITAQKGNKLAFSLLGFHTHEHTVSQQGVLNIQLESAEQNLDEVVVTALGIKRESKGLSYSTQQVKASEVADIKDNSGNFLTNLTGKVAGAVVNTTSGGPGSSARIVLRGNKSISGDNNALIVIDGIVFDNSTVAQPTGAYSNIYSSSDAGANINPDDIESINVLKGPAAAALYGSRAVNGAIIITTKQGAAGQYKIDLSTTQSLEKVANLPYYQNTYGRGNGGVAGPNSIESWGPNIDNATANNHIKNFFNDSHSGSYNLQASGGTEKITSFFSFNNSKIEGIVPNNKMDRNNLDLRINTEFIKGLKTDLKLSYLNQNIKNKALIASHGPAATLLTMPRDLSQEAYDTYEIINPGTGLPQSTFWSTSANTTNHPLWMVNRTSVNENRDRIYGVGSVSYQFFPWMNFMTRFSFDKYNETTEASFYDSTRPSATFLAGGTYYITPSTYSNTNLDLLITGGTDIIPDKIKLNYVLGSSFLHRSFGTYTNMANGLIIPNKFSLAFAKTPSFNGLVAPGGPYNYKRQLNSVFASVNIEFYQSLYLDFTARNDWSSTLPSPHSYFYPSVGLSYVLNSSFNMPEWVNLAKVRGSFTQVGNDAAPNLLQQTFTYTNSTGTGFIVQNETQSIANLKPEKTNSFETGFDLQLFSSRLNLSGTYYKSNSINQLMQLAVSTASGFANKYINAGEIENKGFELQLQSKLIQNESFTWESNLNFARNINKVLSLAENINSVNISANPNYATGLATVGGAYGDLSGQIWKKDPTTGKFIVNANGLPVIENAQILGNPNPSSTLGWNNSFKYKNWGLHVNVDARLGGEMVSGTAAALADYGVADFTEAHRDGNWILDAVDASGNANTKAITAEQFWTAITSANNGVGQFFTFDMTNVRVRNLGLSYNAPRNLLPYVKGAQFTFSVNNALFLYKGKSILDIPGLGKIKNPVDPESSIGSGNFQGVEAGVLPLTRTFTLGVKLSF